MLNNNTIRQNKLTVDIEQEQYILSWRDPYELRNNESLCSVQSDYITQIDTISEIFKKESKFLKIKQILGLQYILKLKEKLVEEASISDTWYAEISKLYLPKAVKRIAFNAWKEQKKNKIKLHLRPGYSHLNSSNARQILSIALTKLQGIPIELTIIENDTSTMRTPLEWENAIYQEKLAYARKIICSDNNIKIFKRFFDIELDEESIFPI